MRGGSFTFEDMLGQFTAMRKMGSIQDLLRMIPGYTKSLSEEQLKVTDKNVLRIEAIILSMTPPERRDPELLNTTSRRKRVASGSGTSVEEVNKLIHQLFETRRQMDDWRKGR